MSNPFFSGRIPKNLNQRAEEYIAETGKSKTELLISALAAYLDFPVEIPGVVPKPEVTKEMFVSLEDRLEKRMAILEEMIRNSNEVKTDNSSENIVISSIPPQKNLEQQNEAFNNLEAQTNDNNEGVSVIVTDNNVTKTEIVHGPVSENQMAAWTKKNRNLLRRHRHDVEEKQLPLNTPLQVEVDGKFYQLKCIAGKKGSGRAAVKEWIAELVENDNTDNKNKNLLSMLETQL